MKNGRKFEFIKIDKKYHETFKVIYIFYFYSDACIHNYKLWKKER